MSDDRQTRVSRRAYELWEQEGGKHGRHEDHWHRADAEIGEHVAVAAPDGTTLIVPAHTERDPAGPAAKRATPKAQTAAKLASTPTAAGTPAKPRKPKAK